MTLILVPSICSPFSAECFTTFLQRPNLGLIQQSPSVIRRFTFSLMQMQFCNLRKGVLCTEQVVHLEDSSFGH